MTDYLKPPPFSGGTTGTSAATMAFGWGTEPKVYRRHCSNCAVVYEGTAWNPPGWAELWQGMNGWIPFCSVMCLSDYEHTHYPHRFEGERAAGA